jgi:hypothetical protein
MAVGLNKGHKVTKNVSKPRHSRRRGVSAGRVCGCSCGAAAGEGPRLPHPGLSLPVRAELNPI